MILHTASPDDYLSEIHRQAPVLNERDNRHRGQILFEFARRGHPEAMAWIAPRVVELGVEYKWLELKGFRGLLDIIHQAEGLDDWRVTSFYKESCSLASELEVRELLQRSDSQKVRVIHFNPCCICREGAIEFLAGVGSLTPELATESQYDAVRFD